MASLFCATPPGGQEESLIGTAPTVQYFVMLECPPPWGKTIEQAKHLPDSLRAMIADPQFKSQGIRFYLIRRERHASSPRLLIFQRPKGFAAGYQAYEIGLSDLSEAAVWLKHYFASRDFASEVPALRGKRIFTRELFVCTHGQYDKCCGRYGYPFYRQAQQYLKDNAEEAVRLWQISHIGGHRFAPTLLSLPDGRYYGRLTLDTFRLLLHCQGQWRSLLSAYRGWSLLPGPLQVLEHSFWLNQGWPWLKQHVRYQVLQSSKDHRYWQVLFAHRSPLGVSQRWWATLVADTCQSILASCGDTALTQIPKYRIAALRSLTTASEKPLNSPDQTVDSQIRF